MKKENILEMEEPVCNKIIEINLEERTDDEERNKFFEELNKALEKSEEDIKHGRVHSAESVFKELREKYGYR